MSWVILDLEEHELRYYLKVTSREIIPLCVVTMATREQIQVLEGLRVDSWRSGDSIAWTSRTFIYFDYFDMWTGLYVPWAKSLWAMADHAQVWDVTKTSLT
ncbi:hypothetical protein CsSME_00019832 [Camellia sinensis var. sinensis]